VVELPGVDYSHPWVVLVMSVSRNVTVPTAAKTGSVRTKADPTGSSNHDTGSERAATNNRLVANDIRGEDAGPLR
jgi:hypothetical protein